MCDACGCGDSNVVPISISERVLAANDRGARHNREHFHDHGVVAVNLMGSPGAGKTGILEATARALTATGEALKVGVLAGDLATDNDARRIRAAGIVAESITTGSACHLDAEMVHRGLHRLTWRTLDDHWAVALEGTNLGDKLYYLAFFDNQGSTQNTLAQPGPPRQWAVTLKRTF